MEELKLQIVATDERDIPKYQTEGASGFDLYYTHTAKDAIILQQNRPIVFDTGIKVSVPKGYELQIRSRSGLAAKDGIFVLNSPGTIDSDYRGTVGVILYNTGNAKPIYPGTRIAQGVIVPVEKVVLERVDVLDDTERSDKGFGSTGEYAKL